MHYASKYRTTGRDFKPEPKPKKEKKGLKRKIKPDTLIEKLDRVFSQFVRKSSADESGFIKCYTCPKILHWKKMHNGHYKDRDHMCTRWHLKNNNCQCPTCNIDLRGNLEVYKSALIRDYGMDIIQELDILSKQITKFSKPELEEMIFEFKEKLALLKLF